MVDSNAVFDLLGSIEDFSRWEEEIMAMVFRAGREVTEKLLPILDEQLAKTRDKKALRCIGFRSRTLVTRLGEVTIKRRLYRDEAGNYRYLLDERLNITKRTVASPSVGTLAATLAAHVPFRVASDLISKLLPVGISHQAIHVLVARIGDALIEVQDQEAEALFESGVLPEGERKPVSELYLEADGTMIALQREKRRKAEVKVGVAYTGKESGGAKDKVVHMDIDAGERFWHGLSTKVIKAFDSSGVAKVFVGGDGASWIRIGTKIFPRASFRLDRFHIVRAIRRALGKDEKTAIATTAALNGDIRDAVDILEEAKTGATAADVKEIDRTIGYLMSNADGLGKGPSLGIIESNVDKLAANRMKKRGMSWSIAGARRMAKLLELSWGGELGSIIIASTSERADLTAVAPLVARKFGSDPQHWLEAHLPSLSGPSASKPWAKALRGIVRGTEIHMSGVVPTKS